MCTNLFSNRDFFSNNKLPSIGFGTFRIPITTNDDSWNTYQSVLYALKQGYRHIDTAPLYNNESEVGRAIHDFLAINKDVSRQDIFITSKISRVELEKGEIDESINHTLKIMDLDYIDMIILHQPCTKDINLKNWEKLVTYQTKYPHLVKHIGVSNFDEIDIQELEDAGMILPEFNQIEVNPFYPQVDLVQFCQKKNIYVVAHTSMAKGEMFLDTFENKMTRRIRANPRLVDDYRKKITILDECAKRNNVTPAQIMLKWGIQKGFTILPRSNYDVFIKENMKLDFEISNEDMIILNNLDCDKCTHPQFHKEQRAKNRQRP